MWRKFDKTFLFFFKLIINAIVGLIFFYVFGKNLPQFTRASRTLGITLATFYVVYFFMLQIFGKFDINVRKSKYVILSLSLVTISADIFAFLALLIMNVGATSRFALSNHAYLYLIMIIILQFIILNILVYLSSFLYFSFVPSENTCVIINNDTDNEKYLNSLYKYKKQYNITQIVDYRDSSVYKYIDINKQIFVLNIPIIERNKILEYCYKNWKNTSFTPDLIDIAKATTMESVIDDFIILNLGLNKMTIEQRIIKRLMDILISLLALNITAPISIIIAIAIKLEDGGKIFYRQKRMTIDRKVFKIYKFRSMYENRADMSFKQAVINDKRITKVGKIIRRFRVDEIPQFINVLKGEMSIVGPRPEAEESYQKISQQIPEFAYRTRMKAGITGLAQIYGKYNTSPQEKLKFDLFYIENFTIWLDIKLIFQTISVFFKKDSVEMNREKKKVSK